MFFQGSRTGSNPLENRIRIRSTAQQNGLNRYFTFKQGDFIYPRNAIFGCKITLPLTLWYDFHQYLLEHFFFFEPEEESKYNRNNNVSFLLYNTIWPIIFATNRKSFWASWKKFCECVGGSYWRNWNTHFVLWNQCNCNWIVDPNQILIRSGSEHLGRIYIWVFWSDLYPRIFWGSIFEYIGRIFIQVFWSDLDPNILGGSGSEYFGRIWIQIFWSDLDPYPSLFSLGCCFFLFYLSSGLSWLLVRFLGQNYGRT